MKRIYTRTYQTPWGAHSIQPISRNGKALTVEYFRENGERIAIVNTSARVISEETYKMMTEETAPKGLKEPKGGKETKDPRRKDQKKKQDLPRGRDLTKAEKEIKGAKPDSYEKGEKRRDEDKPEVGVKKQAKLPVGKAPKAGVFENHDATYHGKDVFYAFKKSGILLGEGVLNESDMSTYRWKAILSACNQAGLSADEIRDILRHLDGHEVQESFSEASEFEDENPGAEPENDAETALDLDDEENDQENEVYTGQSKDELFSNLESVSKGQTEKIQNLPKDTVINVVRIVGSEVDKVLPSKVVKIVPEGKLFKAIVRIQGQNVKIPIMKLPGIMYLKTGAETGAYYYVDQTKADIGYEPKVNYVGDR